MWSFTRVVACKTSAGAITRSAADGRWLATDGMEALARAGAIADHLAERVYGGRRTGGDPADQQDGSRLVVLHRLDDRHLMQRHGHRVGSGPRHLAEQAVSADARVVHGE